MANNPGSNTSSQVGPAGDLQLRHRDGTSQTDRDYAALHPDYVAVDERSLKDLLVFAREYAKELQYFNVQNGSVEAMGDWSAFLSSDTDLDEVVTFILEPGKLPAERAQRYSRPHFALFLTFLQLLRVAQDQLNTLTRRHLDFYYHQVLNMTKQPAVPDQVNVLVDLAPNTREFPLPAGTLLNAGKDRLGQPLVYRTDEDTLLNQAQIARLSSIYVDKDITTIADARGASTALTYPVLLDMMVIALGDPTPGDPLPQYPSTSAANAFTVDETLLQSLLAMVNFIPDVRNGLAMSLDDFRRLIQLKHQRDQADADWGQINTMLAKAGRTRDPNYQFTTTKPRDFDSNLKAALGKPANFDLNHLFTGISGVETIYDAYNQRTRTDVQEAVRTTLFLALTDFITMMQIKTRVDNEWDGINNILAAASVKKGIIDSPEKFKPSDKTAFNTNFATALGAVTFPQKPEVLTSVDTLYAALQRLEAFFYMDAESFVELISLVVSSNTITTVEQWQTVNSILINAYHEKVYAAHRKELDKLRVAQASSGQAFTSMAALALGDNSALEFPAQADKVQPFLANLIDDLSSYLPSSDDINFLNQITSQIINRVAISDADWATTIGILERAERARLPEPVAQKVAWLNLYAAEDATSIKVKLNISGENEQDRWNTFGQGYPSVPVNNPPPPEFGWAVSSPILALKQGRRTVNLTLAIEAANFDGKALRALFTDALDLTATDAGPLSVDGSSPLRIQISTHKGWIEPNAVTIDTISYESSDPKLDKLPALEFELIFETSADPIVSPSAIPESPLTSDWPAIRLMLRQTWQDAGDGIGRYITNYQPFQDLKLVAVAIGVQVEELKPLQMQNDDSVLNSAKPFEPFGLRPVAGSHLSVGEPELVYKKLDSLVFNFEWLGLPKQALVDYYKNYPQITSSNIFTTQINLVDNRSKIPLNSTAQLFSTTFNVTNKAIETLNKSQLSPSLKRSFTLHDTSLSAQAQVNVVTSNSHWTITDGKKVYDVVNNLELKTLVVTPSGNTDGISIDDVSDSINASRAGYPYDRMLDAQFSNDLLDWDRFFQWELNDPDFQHEVYPSLATQKAIQLAVALKGTTTPDAANYQVNPPYTPKLKYLTIDYAASLEILMQSDSTEPHVDRVYYVEPFGYREVQRSKALPPRSLFPTFSNKGELYIGIRNLRPPQNLSLLFQMAEGSADPNLEPVPVQWSYLDHNEWVSLENGNLLQDKTRGLINSGIIQFSLVPAQPSTVLPSDLYWIRVAISEHTDSVADIVAIAAQAVLATFVDQANAPDHLSQPLKTESITKLVAPLPEVVHIRQPYTSFGGKMVEQDSTFYRRTSERLRHKQRALTAWDYEHLVLEHFPQIYKVKCLTASPDNPGQVTVIIIPDIKNKRPFDPFEPKAPADLIADVETYLQPYLPTFAQVKVKNATYIPVRVRFDVRFLPGYNEGYYKQRLNDELNRFLSPWAYVEGAEIVIGSRIYANAIVNFIEKRPYVDFVANVRLFSSEDGVVFLPSPMPSDTDTEGYWVETTRPDGVLVAVRQHIIGTITDTKFEEAKFIGIGYMAIEVDFIVG